MKRGDTVWVRSQGQGAWHKGELIVCSDPEGRSLAIRYEDIPPRTGLGMTFINNVGFLPAAVSLLLREGPIWRDIVTSAVLEVSDVEGGPQQ